MLSEEQTQALKELTARELEVYVQLVHYKLTIKETICCLIFWPQLDLCWSYKKCGGQSPELRWGQNHSRNKAFSLHGRGKKGEEEEVGGGGKGR